MAPAATQGLRETVGRSCTRYTMPPQRGRLLTAALVLALASMLAVAQRQQLQWPRPVLRLWASGVVGLERVLGAADETAFLPGASVTDHQTPRPIEVVVVLGYKVFGDGVPSPLLHLRLAAGAATLTELAEEGPVQLILSGGIPPDVPGRRGLPSEAEAMRNHMQRCFPNALSNPNVSVILEPAAHSTHTNAVNTLTQLKAQHRVGGKQKRLLSVTVATNRFHQLRSLRVFRAVGDRLGLGTDHLLLRAAPIPYSLSVAAQQEYVDARIDNPYIMPSYWQAGGPPPQWLAWWQRNEGREGTELTNPSAAGGQLCGYALTVRREDCCTNAHSPSHWEFQRAAIGAEPGGTSVEHGESSLSTWTTLHMVNTAAQPDGVAHGWVAGERKIFELAEPSSLAGFQYRLLLLAGTNSVEKECAAGENGTEAWRGRHRCNQRDLAWTEWVHWMYMHAWHHGLQTGGAPERAPVLAEWELIRCDYDRHESHHKQQQTQWQWEGPNAAGYVDVATSEDRKSLSLAYEAISLEKALESLRNSISESGHMLFI